MHRKLKHIAKTHVFFVFLVKDLRFSCKNNSFLSFFVFQTTFGDMAILLKSSLGDKKNKNKTLVFTTKTLILYQKKKKQHCFYNVFELPMHFLIRILRKWEDNEKEEERRRRSRLL